MSTTRIIMHAAMTVSVSDHVSRGCKDGVEEDVRKLFGVSDPLASSQKLRGESSICLRAEDMSSMSLWTRNERGAMMLK